MKSEAAKSEAADAKSLKSQAAKSEALEEADCNVPWCRARCLGGRRVC